MSIIYTNDHFSVENEFFLSLSWVGNSFLLHSNSGVVMNESSSIRVSLGEMTKLSTKFAEVLISLGVSGSEDIWRGSWSAVGKSRLCSSLRVSF